jgi:acetyl-CoA carboxylase biotin carboxyl carrier protein
MSRRVAGVHIISHFQTTHVRVVTRESCALTSRSLTPRTHLGRHARLGVAFSVQEISTMQLPLDQLQSLLKTLEEGGASEFEYEDEKVRVKIALARGAAPVVSSSVAAPVAAGLATPRVEAADPNIVYVTSPFVGTFYKAPSPEAEPFVSVSGSVKKGQTLCIIEAMKLMNEIESEFSGTVLEVLSDSGKSVEFGQKLFKIRKS